jgi:hypothetical protein
VVEHSIGNGEVDSSILSGSTIHVIEIIMIYRSHFLKVGLLFFKGPPRNHGPRLAYLDGELGAAPAGGLIKRDGHSRLVNGDALSPLLRRHRVYRRRSGINAGN